MLEQLEEHVVGCKDVVDMQIMMMKGQRTKRQRLPPSPLRLAMSLSSENSGTSSSIDHEELLFRNKSTHEEKEEDQDMANCLILLAQGQKSTPQYTHPLVAAPDHHNNINNKGYSGLYLYECKTCNRCFPSYQALGGHRVSHKKPKANYTQEKKPVTVTTFDNCDPTNTTLTLQLSNRAMHSSRSRSRSRTTMTTTAKSKVHECSICGAQFTSGQALGGHMRRHRDNRASLSMSNVGSPQTQQANTPRNVLKLDLNLPAHEDDNRGSKFPVETKEKVFDISATSLVDCHY